MIVRVGSRIVIGVPDGWAMRDSLQLVSPDRRLHLAVSGEPVAVGTTMDAYAERYGTLNAQRLPGYELVAEERSPLLGGRDTVVRTFSWAAPDRPPVTQVQGFCVVADRGYVATATVPAAFFPTAKDAIMSILGAVTLVEPSVPTTGDVPVGAPQVGSVEIEPVEVSDDWTGARTAWTEMSVPA